ncbi:50S ribosomal protein L11 methyltransferase [Erythrobacter sp. SCSIO 43205]|uniref:50S ribosomal protein L11 methyltransferase n=1 Tax=Erythrobacter sp. SCSIO 43205 TaxID=2779361 RepID=UPI001CA93304|nr:50S ribosomal protein L11 methyltransferase [Erythrobacter sp. SCSIO 43205]UAB77324.1 50S ribosomal protein L11 methyltransferase [Erythrobacter sp. SCSIO 43205]
MTSWKLTAHAPKKIVQAALLAHDELEEWDFDLVIAGRELDEAHPQDWVLEGWYPTKPGKEQIDALKGLFEGPAPDVEIEKLPETDWVAQSQQGTPPIRAGRFYVHTPDFEPDPGLVNFVIPASQAFGTGQHDTTAGCLEVLSKMKSSAIRARRIADIGTGTGLLGFAAMHLWPNARTTASDIDPVCADVVHDNAELNDIPLGSGPGEMTMVIADGMDDPLLRLRGPYDLLIANILAGPLVELSHDFAENVAPGGSLLLAGLLQGKQESAVRRAYRRVGFRLAGSLKRGDWAILWFKRRRII